MAVRWREGKYVTTGVDAAIEANRSLAASLNISPVELEKLMKNPPLFIKLEPILKTHQGIGIAGALEILLDELAGQQNEDQNPYSGQIDWNRVDVIIAEVIRSR